MKRKNLLAFLLLPCLLCIAVLSTACGNKEATDKHQHAYALDWSYDTYGHWHTTTCGHDEVVVKQPHDFEDGVCRICKYKKIGYGNATASSWRNALALEHMYDFTLTATNGGENPSGGGAL